MRILVAHNVSRQRAGGMSRIMGFIHDEVEAAGHTVDWLCAEDVPRRWRGSRARFGFPWLVWRTAREAARRGRAYDVVNVHEPHGALVSLDARRVSRHGVAVTSHGLEQRAWELALEERRRGRSGPSLKSRLVYPSTSLWQSRLALTRAQLVFVLNEEDRRYLVSRWRVAPERVRRMKPGASPIFAEHGRARSYGDARRLVFAGTWRKNKGIEDLIPAFHSLARAHAGLSLTVLGAGIERPQVLRAFAADLHDRVEVIPHADDELAARTLASSDVFVLPSLFEGTPLTLVEAMMSALPIVTTDTCGMRDTLIPETTALLVPIRSPDAIVSAVRRLLQDAPLRARLGQAARAFALDRHTWPAVAGDVLEAYVSLAARSAA